jgi:hypothetical protein
MVLIHLIVFPILIKLITNFLIENEWTLEYKEFNPLSS